MPVIKFAKKSLYRWFVVGTYYYENIIKRRKHHIVECVVGEWIIWWRHNTNPGYHVLPNFSPGGSANQIAVFTSN